MVKSEYNEVMDYWHSESLPDRPIHVEQPITWRRVMIDTLETILLSLLLFLVINTASERIRVESVSMQPNLYAGDFVIVNKLLYTFFQEPERGDVIVFHYPRNPSDIPYIKRVVGLPGDQVHIADGMVYVNGEILVEPYISIPTNQGGDWSVPPDSYFVMGDNRNNSSDSRTWGFVPAAQIIGRAELVYWPPQDWGLLHVNMAVAAPSP